MEAGAWAVEVKQGRQIPKRLLDWWHQTQRNTPAGKTPLLVLHPKGAKYADSLAVIRLADLFAVTHLSGCLVSLSLVHC